MGTLDPARVTTTATIDVHLPQSVDGLPSASVTDCSCTEREASTSTDDHCYPPPYSYPDLTGPGSGSGGAGGEQRPLVATV